MSEKPYLILTLRRTGGTSLMSNIGDLTSFPKVSHEPLNKDRVWGEITKAFVKTGSTDALYSALEEVLAPRPIIKHCIEVVPVAVTFALIQVCKSLGYKVYVLTRQREDRRLISLICAMSTKAWGAPRAAEIYPKILSGEEIPEAVDIKLLRRRIELDSSYLGRTLAFLRFEQIDYRWILFEDVYSVEDGVRIELEKIAGEIGVDFDMEKLNSSDGDARRSQNSKQIEHLVPGMDEAKKLIDKLLPRPQPYVANKDIG